VPNRQTALSKLGEIARFEPPGHRVDSGCQAGGVHEVPIRIRRDGEPFGTRTPAPERFRYISPSEAFFPPTSGTSLSMISLNQRMNIGALGMSSLHGAAVHAARQPWERLIAAEDQPRARP
jgi:hypothetical protein